MNFVDLDTHLKADNALRKIRDLHRPCCDEEHTGRHVTACIECGDRYPCDTAKIILEG